MIYSSYCKFLLSAAIILASGFAMAAGTSHETVEPVKVESVKDKRIFELIDRANILVQKNYDHVGADSLLGIAIDHGESVYDNNLLLELYTAYMQCMEQGYYPEKRQAYAKKAERLNILIKDKQLNWNAAYWVSDVYLAAYKYDKALDYSYKALSIAEYYHDEVLKARSYLSIGACQEKRSQQIEAYRYYLQALNIAERKTDKSLLVSVYKVLSKFYLNIKDYDKAVEYKLKQAAILRNEPKQDSSAMPWIKFELEEISFVAENKINEHNIRSLFNIAHSTGDKRLWKYTVSLYRSYLIANDRFAVLLDFYTLQYPEELLELKTKDQSMYFRIMALISEVSGKRDSAMFYFDAAAKLLENNPSKEMKASFYYRYGQFLKRQNNNQGSISKFEKALLLAREASYLSFAVTASDELEKAYFELADFKNAYHYSKINKQLTDSLSINSKRDDLLLMEIENTRNQLEEEQAATKEETTRRHNLQYIAIIILIGIVFLILIVLGSFRVPKWSIQFVGFFSFIFLFEFIVLIFDKKIEVMTHGEPWKVLGIKIILIGILLPLHHWIEGRVIRFLLNNKLINFNGFSLRQFLKELFFHSDAH